MSEGTSKLLVVKDLTTTFATRAGPLAAVVGVSFDLNGNETLGIVGESGSGKTVLSRTIMGLQQRTNVTVTGSVLLNGHEMVGASEKEKRKLWGTEVAMVFQDPMTSLNPVMRVGKQIDETLRVRLGMSRADAKVRAIELLELVGIPSPARRYGAYPGQLSGGMRQRGVVATRTSKIVVMYAGRIVEMGSTREVFTNHRMPYTRALLDSSPKITNPSHTRLTTIPGRPPNLLKLYAGCSFAPRCAYATERCHVERPELTPAGQPGHFFACWNPLTSQREVVAS